TMYAASLRLSHMAWIVMSSSILGWVSGYPVIPVRVNGPPISASRSSKDRALSKRPAGGSASPAGTKPSSIPHAVSLAPMSARCAWSRTSRADRCGTTRYPRPASRSARPRVASRPLLGEAVTVTVMPAGIHSATASSTFPAGNTSYLGCSSNGAAAARPLRNGPPRITAGSRQPARPGSWPVVPADQRLQFVLQPAGPGLDHGERHADPGRAPPGLHLQRRFPVLGQPDQPAVMAEVLRPQLRVPVESQFGEHGAAEAADQEVGEHVRAWFGLEHRPHPV